MKWEILKGSENDFEGAPEWSLMLLKHVHSGKIAFSESNIKGARRTDLHDGMFDSEIMHPEDFVIIAERRPITEPVVWLNLDECDGSEYLGPVIGKEMECHAKDGSIFEVVVVAFDGDLPIVKTRLHGNYFGCDPSQLKPIR